MSHLQQMQLTYQPIEDRLLLSISTQDFSEYRFWVTRRAAKLLWGILVQLIQASPKSSNEQKHTSEEIAKKIQQQKEQRHPLASKFATSATRKPLGEEPALLFGIKATAPSAGSSTIALQFEDHKGHSLQIAGDLSVILALCQLLQETTQVAEWGLNLHLPEKK